MERLEAALEKARHDRKTVRRPEPTIVSDVAEAVQGRDRWESLPEIAISTRTALRNRITALNHGKDSGAYDLLRSRALRLMRENDWTTLAITSPNKTCGKTTLCANLALSLGRQADLRVVVLDLDLRRPALHKLLGHRSENSLHEVLAGKHAIDSAFVRTGPNLAFGLNKTPANNPSELLQSKMTKAKLDEIKEAFQPDLMIFDMPPMLATDENVGFLPFVDCGLLVGAANSTTMTQLDTCEKELSELTNVLGVVLNKCRFKEKDSGYDFDYG